MGRRQKGEGEIKAELLLLAGPSEKDWKTVLLVDDDTTQHILRKNNILGQKSNVLVHNFFLDAYRHPKHAIISWPLSISWLYILHGGFILRL